MPDFNLRKEQHVDDARPEGTGAEPGPPVPKSVRLLLAAAVIALIAFGVFLLVRVGVFGGGSSTPEPPLFDTTALMVHADTFHVRSERDSLMPENEGLGTLRVGAKVAGVIDNARRESAAARPGVDTASISHMKRETSPSKRESASVTEGSRKPTAPNKEPFTMGPRKGRVVHRSTKPVKIVRQHGWYIQLASWKEKSNADDQLGRLRRIGYGGFVQKALVRHRMWYRVAVGPYRTQAEAASVNTDKFRGVGFLRYIEIE